MADEPERREVLVRFWDHPVKRTEEEIEELRLGGLLRDEPSILDKLPPRAGRTPGGAAIPAAAQPAGQPVPRAPGTAPAPPVSADSKESK